MVNLSRLKGSQRIRQRTGVNLGSDDIRGVQQTFFEVVSNSIDRFKKGYGEEIIITKHKDLSYTIEDFADGLPMDWNENEKSYNWDLALKVLYAGENYEESNRQNGELGYNGLGLVSTQYSSEYMNVVVNRDGYTYEVNCKKGRPVDKNTLEFICEDDDYTLSKELGEKVLKKYKNNYEHTGTKIIYKPDLEVFTDINIPNQWIFEKLKKQAVINTGLKIIYIDEIENQTYEFKYNSIIDYLKELSEENTISDFILFKGSGEGQDVKTKPVYNVNFQFAFAFSNQFNLFEHYHNSSELTDRKSVTATSIEKALTDAIHKYLTQNNLYNKGEPKIKFTDIEDSLICILSSKSSYTSYANQTKLSIDNRFIKEFLTEQINNKLEIYFTENKLEADKIANQVLINSRANNKANQTKLDIKKKLQINNGGKSSLSQKIEGVKHCDMRNSKLEERYFLIDEGVSANSTISDAIDGRIMGCCGLKGRFINSLKASVSKVLENEPALKIIQALGCGIEIPYNERKKYKHIDCFDINNLKYANVGILCDADAFGKGINLSLITFFYKFFPTLLKQNRINLVISPRYEVVTKNETIFCYNESEKLNIIDELKSKNKSYYVGIKKGLGEFNKEDFYKYVLCEEARKKTFIPIEYEGAEDIIKYHFDMLMGDDITNRKQFIKDNIVNINLNEIE